MRISWPSFSARRACALAVHSGTSSAPRASALEQLEAGHLDVIFAVDIFNEGVDLPQIDTVMMLRPTESSVIWLQQFGRGLRKAEQKEHLTVIDYIGNHRTFLIKTRTLLQPLLDCGPGDRDIAAALRRVQAGDLNLPDGCEITYELEAVRIIESLFRVPQAPDAIRAFYEDFRERHGQRPRAVELLHEGYNPRSLRKSHGSWHRFVRSMDDLTEDERAVLDQHANFLEALEITPMTKSYKMLVLQSLLNRDQLPGEIDIDSLTDEFSRLAHRSQILRQDVGPSLENHTALIQLIEDNPINAWTSGKGTGGKTYFAYDDRRFRSTFEVAAENRTILQELVREIVEWRLAEYLQRPSRDDSSGTSLVCRVLHASGRPILKLPDRAKTPGVPEGWTTVTIDDKPHEAKFAKLFVNVLREQGSEDNVLGEVMRRWFGPDAGLPGTQFEVVFQHTAEGWVLRPHSVAADATGQAQPWRHYLREKIPPLFGFEFNPGIWNTGFIVRPGHIFLLVTLDKGRHDSKHQYEDRFLSPEVFQWQSQNRTRRDSKHGQLILDHAQQNTQVHLFVRHEKAVDGKGAPFVYCGEVDFLDWQGDAPITVRWKLREAVPEPLREHLIR